MNRRIAIQGIEGSYSDEAVNRLAGDGSSRLSYSHFEQTLWAVSSGIADLAVVPVFNSISGEISIVTRLIRKFGLELTRMTRLEIDHVLIGVRGAALEGIRSVSSHPQALKQCGEFLRACPEIKCVESSDTASAVREIVEAGDPSQAAIASRRAAQIHGGEIILENISDNSQNTTTFCLVGRQPGRWN